ncbi:MAG: hypothetical protein MZW92_28020 [Comamonadaceae bacterium]|nr:hypothetical protein [Comamonadaceae bacterium]
MGTALARAPRARQPGRAPTWGGPRATCYLQVYQDRVTGASRCRSHDFNARAAADRQRTARSRRDTLDAADRLPAGLLPPARHGVRPARSPLVDPLHAATASSRRAARLARLSFDLPTVSGGVPDRLTFDYSVLFDEDPDHRGFLMVEHNWADRHLRPTRTASRSSSARARAAQELEPDVVRPACAASSPSSAWEPSTSCCGLDHIFFLARRCCCRWRCAAGTRAGRPLERVRPGALEPRRRS